jgi:hypothetical protein
LRTGPEFGSQQKRGPDSLAARLFCGVPAFDVANWARFVAAIGAGTEAGFAKADQTGMVIFRDEDGEWQDTPGGSI